MSDDLKCKVCLITGGARGIGAATARKFADAGATVIITDMLEEDGQALADSLPDAGFFLQDVTDEARWGELVERITEEQGGIDVLVNNAGVAGGMPVEAMDLQTYRGIMTVNMEAVFLGTKAVLPVMKPRTDKWKGGGSIINLSSILGIIAGGVGTTAYAASKGAVKLFTKNCASEFASLEYNIRVNSIHPGFIDTQLVRGGIRNAAELGMIESENEAVADLIERHPIGRLGIADEIAEGALFLASARSAFMTGSELVIDGGYTAV